MAMTPSDRARHALETWPGTIAEVCAESGFSRARLNHWNGVKGGSYLPPTEAEAERVEEAVKALLVDRLRKLGGATMQL